MLALALVITPLTNFLPSKRQKQQIALRDQARSLGLSVQLATIPTPQIKQHPDNAYLQRIQSSAESGAVYRLHRDKEQMKRFRGHTLAYIGRRELCPYRDSLDEDWFWFELKLRPRKGVDEILACLNQLPDDVKAIESNAAFTAAYWTERGDDNAVAEIYRLLSELQQIESSLIQPKPY